MSSVPQRAILPQIERHGNGSFLSVTSRSLETRRLFHKHDLGTVSRWTKRPRLDWNCEKLLDDGNLLAKTCRPSAPTAHFLNGGHPVPKIARVGRPSRQSRTTGREFRHDSISASGHTHRVTRIPGSGRFSQLRTQLRRPKSWRSESKARAPLSAGWAANGVSQPLIRPPTAQRAECGRRVAPSKRDSLTELSSTDQRAVAGRRQS